MSEKLEDQLIKTIESRELKNMLKDSSESLKYLSNIAVENYPIKEEIGKFLYSINIVEQEILKEELDKFSDSVPYLKTIYGLTKLYGSFNDYILIKKIHKCLFQISEVSFSDRKKMLADLAGKKKRKIITKLLFSLNKYEDLQKAGILGNLFSGYLLGIINYNDFFSLAHSLDQLNLSQVPSLKIFYEDDPNNRILSQEDKYSILFLRLGTISGLQFNGENVFSRNRLGTLMVLVGLRSRIPIDFVEKVIGKEESNFIFGKLNDYF